MLLGSKIRWDRCRIQFNKTSLMAKSCHNRFNRIRIWMLWGSSSRHNSSMCSNLHIIYSNSRRWWVTNQCKDRVEWVLVLVVSSSRIITCSLRCSSSKCSTWWCLAISSKCLYSNSQASIKFRLYTSSRWLLVNNSTNSSLHRLIIYHNWDSRCQSIMVINASNLWMAIHTWPALVSQASSSARASRTITWAHNIH